MEHLYSAILRTQRFTGDEGQNKTKTNQDWLWNRNVFRRLLNTGMRSPLADRREARSIDAGQPRRMSYPRPSFQFWEQKAKSDQLMSGVFSIEKHKPPNLSITEYKYWPDTKTTSLIRHLGSVHFKPLSFVSLNLTK